MVCIHSIGPFSSLYLPNGLTLIGGDLYTEGSLTIASSGIKALSSVSIDSQGLMINSVSGNTIASLVTDVGATINTGS